MSTKALVPRVEFEWNHGYTPREALEEAVGMVKEQNMVVIVNFRSMDREKILFKIDILPYMEFEEIWQRYLKLRDVQEEENLQKNPGTEKGPTYKEVQEKRRQVIRDVHKILSDFHKETGYFVTGIDISKHLLISGETGAVSIGGITIEVC